MKIKFNVNVSSIHGPYRSGEEVEVTEEFGKDMVKAKHAVEIKPEPVVAEESSETKKPASKKDSK